MVDFVALVKYEGDLGKALEEGIELLGGFGVVKSPFIPKPNICTGVDKTGFAITDVKIVEALINLVLEEDRNLSVKIVESDSMSKFADGAFEKFGYKSLEEKMRNSGFDVSLVNFSRSPTVQVKLDGPYFKNPELRRLTFTSIRHFYGTKLYHKGNTLLEIQKIRGHKRFTSTLQYINYEIQIHGGTDEWICKVAESEEDRKTLVEKGF
jgi:uncharacterized protein (DUF362 family)